MYILAIETTGPYGSVALISDTARIAAHRVSKESMSHLRDLMPMISDMLSEVGADEKDINRSLFRQTGVFFLLPLLLACIHSIFGIKFASTIFEVFGTTGLLPAMLATAIIVIVIYCGYFLITYYCGKGIIRSRS